MDGSSRLNLANPLLGSLRSASFSLIRKGRFSIRNTHLRDWLSSVGGGVSWELWLTTANKHSGKAETSSTLGRLSDMRRSMITLMLCLVSIAASTVASANPPTLEESVRGQLIQDNPKFAKGTSIEIRTLKVSGQEKALGGNAIKAVYKGSDGQEFRNELYFYRKGHLKRLDNGLMAIKWHSGVVCGKAFYYSYSGGSGQTRNIVCRLTLENGKATVIESRGFFNIPFISLKLNGTKVVAEESQDGQDDLQNLGIVTFAKGVLDIVDGKGQPVLDRYQSLKR